MKKLRKWSRILHRDIGFFFIGTTIIYGLSGIALNHMKDWNPNYIVSRRNLITELDLNKSQNVEDNVLTLLDRIDNRKNYRSYYFPNSTTIKIFLKGGSSVIVNTITGEGVAEFLKKRAVFYQSNVLHYNPTNWWKWFSDIFAGALIFFAITSTIMVRGKKGIKGRGGIYMLAGIIIPILFLIFM
ncbi:PepSY-associated TM helix domain-containing protein [Bacteroidota bacterium]